MKFKIGDILTPVECYHGFEDAMVTGVIERKGRQYYTLRIMNGTATIPVSAEVNYKLKTEENEKSIL